MSGYTPDTSAAQSYYVAGRAQLRRQVTGEQAIDITECSHEFDRWLADVERASAEKAVRGFVRRVSDSIEDYLSIATLDELGAEYIRAAAYRREETE